jgi:hypothetical protein
MSPTIAQAGSLASVQPTTTSSQTTWVLLPPRLGYKYSPSHFGFLSSPLHYLSLSLALSALPAHSRAPVFWWCWCFRRFAWWEWPARPRRLRRPNRPSCSRRSWSAPRAPPASTRSCSATRAASRRRYTRFSPLPLPSRLFFQSNRPESILGRISRGSVGSLADGRTVSGCQFRNEALRVRVHNFLGSKGRILCSGR